MLTGPRGKIYLSYKWEGETFKNLVTLLAVELTRRGYEAVYDDWYIQNRRLFSEDCVKTLLWEEFASSNFFTAVLTKGYFSVLSGTAPGGEVPSQPLEEIRNDGRLLEEYRLAVQHFEGAVHPKGIIGLGIGVPDFPKNLFPHPVYEIGENPDGWEEILDKCFGPCEELPEMIRPEFKYKDQWYSLPIVPLTLAYPLLRRTLQETRQEEGDTIEQATVPSLWSRIESSHIIYDTPTAEKKEEQACGEDAFLFCEECTMQAPVSLVKEGKLTCPRCGRGILAVKARTSMETAAVIAPMDAFAENRIPWPGIGNLPSS